MKLGIFDSGIGGKAVAASLATFFPEATITVVNDRENVPYGSKTRERIIALTDAAIQPLLADRCDVIIIACNSATMAAIETLRERYPNQSFIGLEPMVKPAAQMTKTDTIAVCATPATLSSKRYKWLVDTYARGIKVIEPDCSMWARMIEDGAVDRDTIATAVKECVDQNADVIVLGCTHYHWIKGMVEELAGDQVTVLEPSDAIARRVTSILSAAGTQGTALPASR